jgi:hypothetical protein
MKAAVEDPMTFREVIPYSRKFNGSLQFAFTVFRAFSHYLR